MFIAELFEKKRKRYLELLKEKQPKGISIIQEFVRKHIDENLFVKGSGVELFDYMNDSLAICFHNGGTGDCEQFYPLGDSASQPAKVSLNPDPQFSNYDLEDYSSKKYEYASEQFRIWSVNKYLAWALECWQKSLVNTKVPFAFFSDYDQSFYFDLLKMEHGENDEWTTQPTKLKLEPEELFFRISSLKFNHVFLEKGETILEIGVLFQPKLNFVYERQYQGHQWHFTKKIEGKKGGINDIRNIGAQFLRKAIEEGFQFIKLPSEISYEPPTNFILPSILFWSKNHWGEDNNITIEDFETQFNIQLPKDYREFLKTYNGFQTHGYYGFGYTKYDSIRPILFYGLTENVDYDIVSHIEKMRFKCLPDYIPIGEDVEKNQIWIGVSDSKRGQVIYKRFEAPQKKIVTYEVDNSFQKFLNEFHYENDAGISHVVEANDLDYFKKYLKEKWNWDDAIAWNRTVLDIIVWRNEPRPVFLDYAFSEGKRLNRLHRFGYHLVPEIVAVFDKHNIDIPKICYSNRLKSIIQSDKAFDENEFNELIKRGADINVFQVYETLQKWTQNNATPFRQAMIEKLKPLYKDLTDSERIELAIDQKEITFFKYENLDNDFDLSNFEINSKLKYPNGLIKFLKKYQGSTPNLPFFEFTISAGNDHHFVEIDHFLSSSEIQIHYSKVKSILELYEIQDQHLPIAITKSDGYVLVNCQNESEQFGNITFIYNHIIRWDRHKPHKDFKYKKSLKPTLSEFLLSLVDRNYVFDEMSFRAKKGDIDYFKQRLEKGWNINVYTQTEQTCLHQAVRNNHYKLAQFFLENGANVNMKVATPDWDSTLAIAMKYADEKMYQLIFEYSDLEYTKDFEQLKSYLKEYYGKHYL